MIIWLETEGKVGTVSRLFIRKMESLSILAIATMLFVFEIIAGDHARSISIEMYSECTQFVSPMNETVVQDILSVTSCAVQCAPDTRCVAFSVSATDDICMLHREMFLTGICYTGEWYFYNVQDRCMNGGDYSQDKHICQCYGGYIGQFCERIMQDCSEGYKSVHYHSGEGIYLIHPSMAPFPFSVWCRMQYVGNTYIQRRIDGSTSFNRSWQDYKNGFGDLSKNFWLGNDKIAYITNGRAQNLIFETKDESSPNIRQRVYKEFVLSQDGLYSMTYTNTWGHGEPSRHGGDCLVELKGQPFSTFDQDRDDSPQNCAQEHGSGFWFKNCTACNPNGVWSDPPEKKRAGIPEEMFWDPVSGDNLIMLCYAFLAAV
ncbi:fibroleukin-like [Haliotis rufescens]|uniref:fibroleukin-like n=1 Tax=Haliotis rufescens TaxID=6454 RepID=UPI00201F140F|nr:fibroleukin-like [Haliotis rufescens]